MVNVIELKNVSKRYKSGFELKNIDLKVKKGVITGFIGENGAGKTTVLKLILNILKVDNGSIKIFGKDIYEFDKDNIGVVLDNMFFPDTLNAKDLNVIFKEVYKDWDESLYNSYLEDFRIPIKSKIKELSKGMKKKLEIATALSHKPKLLLLDEPTSGLDPVIRNEILDIFLDFIQNEENSIFLSTHITSDLDRIADDIIFIDDGDILLEERKDKIINNYGVLKCNIEDIDKLDRSDILSKKKTKYFFEILVNDKDLMRKKYPNFVVDNITLEELMVLMIKGERG